MTNNQLVSLSELTCNEISGLIEKSLVDYLKAVVQGQDRPFVLNDQIGWIKTLPTAWSNYIFYFNARSVEQDVNQVVKGIKEGNLPDEWLIGPASRPLDLACHLENEGFEMKYNMTGMAIDLEQADLSMNMPENVHIVSVDSEALLKTWAAIISEGLWNGDPFEAGLFQHLVQNPNYRFYVAFFEEKPVAASMLQLSGGVAGIDLVATLRPYWRRGIGTVMTKTPLKYAQDKGYKIGVLQASQAGDPCYRKIGFKEYCRFPVYKYVGVVNKNK